MQKFKDIAYIRPDFEKLEKEIIAITEKVKKAASAEELLALIKECDAASAEAETMGTVAHIRNTVDSRDEFYDAEMKYINSAEPKLIPAEMAYQKAILASPYRKELEEKIGNQLFRDMEMAVMLRSEKIMDDLVRESDL